MSDVKREHALLSITVSAACATIAPAADLSFAAPITTQLSRGHTHTAVRLGDLDAIVTGRNWSSAEGDFGRVAVLKGNGDGTFTAWPDVLVSKCSSEDA